MAGAHEDDGEEANTATLVSTQQLPRPSQNGRGRGGKMEDRVSLSLSDRHAEYACPDCFVHFIERLALILKSALLISLLFTRVLKKHLE